MPKTPITRYEVNDLWKSSNEDDFEEGELDNGSDMEVNVNFHGDTVDSLIDQIMSFVLIDDKQNVMINACEEEGRIDFQTMEDVLGSPADKNDYELWKKKCRRLWSGTYTAHVEKVTRETFKLEVEGFSPESGEYIGEKNNEND